MATSYERVLEAVRHYPRDLRLRELPNDTAGRQQAQCSCPTHDGDSGTSLHITYDQTDGKTMLHCFGAEHCDTASIAGALGLKIIDLFDQQSGPQGHAGYSGYNSYSCDSRLTAADLAAIRHANAVHVSPNNGNETTTTTSSLTKTSAAIEKQYVMPEPYLEPLPLGHSPMFAAICTDIAIQPSTGLLHGTCPNCGVAGSLTVLYSPLESATLLRCSTCQADDVLNALNASATLTRSNGYEAMIYDSERGTAYEYADGLIVRRSPAKRISQSGNTAGKHPLWMAADAKRAVALGKPVYLTEGEKDAGTLRALGYAAVTAAGGGGNFATKLDLDSARSALSGANVVAIVDKDDTGTRWKEQVAQTLTPFVRSLTFIQAAGEAHDASDAAMSGLEFEILPSESSQPGSDSEPMHRAYSLTRLADVEPERPLWLWPGHIPKGKIVLIDGDPATGKSTLALDIAAHVTTGTIWPDGSAGCEPANVLLLTAEDGLADTVSPRIRAAQGDASKMFALSEVFKDGKEIAITLTDALPQIAQAVREQHIGLIIVDVLMSFLGSDTNSYKDQDIRAQVMAPLKRLCEETGCTVIALRHLNKGPGAAIYRGGGSIGIVGAARAAFLVAKDPENEERRLFAPVKFNLGPIPRAMAYRLEDNPLLGCARVHWLGETDDTAESLNQSAYGTGEREDSDVRTFIQDYFDRNKELTPDGLYWGVPSYRVINEAKGEFSKQQVLDGRRRPKPLLASKKYGNMWWWLPVDYENHKNQDTCEESNLKSMKALSEEQAADPEAAMSDPVTATRAAAILPSSSKPSYCNVLSRPDKTAFPILPDDADPWVEPKKTQNLQGLTANDLASKLARRQDGTSKNTTYHLATSEADDSATDTDSWKAHLPPYATELHYQQLNATQLRELIGKGGLWASKARREMARRERNA